MNDKLFFILKIQVNDKCFQYIMNFYFILIFYHRFMIYIVL